MAKDKFSQLVDDLVNGDLSILQVQIAIRASIRQRQDIPDAIKGLLAGTGESHGGLIYQAFSLIQQIIGNMELAYRRGLSKE